MKYSPLRCWLVYVLSALCIFSTVEAQLNDDDYRTQTMIAGEDSAPADCYPYSVSFYFDVTGKAEIDKCGCKHKFRNVQFAVAELDASMLWLYNCYCDEGLILTGGYNFMYLDWKNPYVKQDDFHTLSAALGAFTHRLCNWTWEAEVRVNATLDDFNFDEYLTFDMILAGRYEWSPCLGLYAGFIALTGMKIDHVYPVIGFDWQVDDRWKLNMVFPLNMSVVYMFNCRWSAAIAARFFDERHRCSTNNPLPRAIVEYRASGIEVALNYISCDKNFVANIHLGGILGGRVKVSNRHHHNSHRHRFNATPYAGAEIAYRF